MYLKPKDKEIEKVFDRLMKYPVLRTKRSQDISRYKVVRILNSDRKNPAIYISKNIVGLSPNIKISKKGNRFDIRKFF